MTLVSHDNRFIFLKTTKTASTSAEIALQVYCLPDGPGPSRGTEAIETAHGIVGARGRGVEDAAPRRGLFGKRYPWVNHMPAALVAANLGRRVFDAYAKVATVRNPFDRMVSHFHFFTRDTGPAARDFADTRAAFRHYVLSGDWSNDAEIVTLEDSVVIDHFLRQENLDADLARLADRLGLDRTRLSLPHLKDNSALREGRRTEEYFDPETTAAVRHRMAWVFDHVDYPSEPGAPLAARLTDPAATARQR